VSAVVHAIEGFFLAYLVLAHGTALALNLLAIPTLRRKVVVRPLEALPPVYSGFEPPVSLLVTARDDEATIVAWVRSLLEIDFPEFEVVVVNDGSSDGTLAALEEAFGLEVFPEAHWRRLRTRPIRAIYHSRVDPRLRVVDKDFGGKADALNVGINASRFPLFCAMETRWILQRDSLHRAVEPFIDDPATVASAGAARIANGCTLDRGQLERAELPRSLLATLQVVESLRTLHFARIGWAAMNALLVVGGALTVFRKDAVVEAGGYQADTDGEDMELAARLHRLLRARGQPYAIHFLADPVCWTSAPESLSAVAIERIRAQRDLCQGLHDNRGLSATRRAGAPGWIALPLQLLLECHGPLIELAGYAFMAAMWAAGALPGAAFAAFLALAFALGFLVSASALVLEETSSHLYPRFSQMARLIAVAALENLGYRQLVAGWRVVGTWRGLTRERD